MTASNPGPTDHLTGNDDDNDEPIVPPDHAVESEDFGMTALEESEGEPLDQRLAREVPDSGDAVGDDLTDHGGLSTEVEAMHLDRES